MTIGDLGKLCKKRGNKRVREVLDERAASVIVQQHFDNAPDRGWLYATDNISTSTTASPGVFIRFPA